MVSVSGARLEDFPSEYAIVLNEDRDASVAFLLHFLDCFSDVEQDECLLFALIPF
ncbi:MAG: hypothetical protein RL141_795 [Candidatus Parcubacteria bacterium]